MKTFPLAAGLSIALLLGSPLLQAAPQEYPDQRPGQESSAQKQRQASPEQRQKQSHAEQKHSGPSQSAPAQNQGKQSSPARYAQQPSSGKRQQPPADFSSVRKTIQARRAQIGRGPDLPPGVHIQKGKPLPKGYGKPLDAKALKGLPHYPDYEWRRVGGDMVLVAIGTGGVFAILQGVLNN